MSPETWRPWTEAEDALARELIATGAPPTEFKALLGRSKDAARAHLKSIDNPAHRAAASARCAAQRHRPLPRGNIVVAEKCPPEVLADAARRANAPLSLTAVLCGDPPAGRPWPDGRKASEGRA